jgi:hypothetical protein
MDPRLGTKHSVPVSWRHLLYNYDVISCPTGVRRTNKSHGVPPSHQGEEISKSVPHNCKITWVLNFAKKKHNENTKQIMKKVPPAAGQSIFSICPASHSAQEISTVFAHSLGRFL